MKYVYFFIGVAIFIFVVSIGRNIEGSPISQTEYTVVSPTHFPQKESLQLDTLQLISIAPTLTGSVTNPSPQDCTVLPGDSVSAIKSALKTDYGVILLENTGNTSLGLSRAKSTYQTICMLGQSPVFKKALFSPGTSAPVAIYWNNANWCALNGALHKGGNICSANGVNEDCINLGANSCPQLTDPMHMLAMAHELGHVLNWRRPDLFAKWCKDVYTGGASASCITSTPHAIPTYSCLYDYGMGPFASECWADMLGEYITYKSVRALPWYPAAGTSMSFTTDKGRVTDKLQADFKEFPTMFSKYYTWTRDNIFGGVTF